MVLESSITEVKGIGPKKAAAFEKLGVKTLRDLLYLFPRDYEDMRNKKLINSLINEEKAVVIGTVMMVVNGRGFGRKRTLHLSVADKSGSMEVLFFSAGFMAKAFKIGTSYRFYGKVKVDKGKVTMFHPSYAPIDSEAEEGIIPVYPLKSGLSQKDIRNCVKLACSELGSLPETLPDSVIKNANLCPLSQALANVHFPAGRNEYAEARYRLIFEELFELRTALRLSADRFGNGRKGISFKTAGEPVSEFTASLPYKLTAAQQKVLSQICMDMDSDKAMNRLVQGDVGSGKTAVAEAALYKCIKAGYQGAYMAPTEILAAQHFKSFSEDFKSFGVNIDLLTSSLTASEKKQVLFRLASGETDIIIGTHALISEAVQYSKLGLVITDEQHRFGVNQRKLLTDKGENPDVLVMTATPIPRTLAVVLYSDLDISIIDELPAGRKSIITESFNDMNRKEAYRLLLSEVRKGRQAYIVAPFIEDSESIDGYSAEGLYEEFKNSYPEISCALLHGEVKAEEKDTIMASFSKGEISVLISTVVIEVGINVANATVMLIENTERFGLAQLHQLRGRVGRGEYQSYCCLVLGEESEIAKQRTEIMCQNSDGFVIAEKDLEIRGPGEVFGYRQHGLPQLHLADPVKHVKIIEKANTLADKLLAEDPKLNLPVNRAYGEYIRTKFADSTSLVL